MPPTTARRARAALAALCASSALLLLTASARADDLILRVKPGKLKAGLADKLTALGGEVLATLPQVDALVVRVDGAARAEVEALSGLAAVMPDVSVRWREPVAVVPLGAPGLPADEEEDDFLYPLQWAHDALDSRRAWERGARGQGTLVAVLDDGIDSDHPDLAPNLRVDLSASFVPGQGFEYEELYPGDAYSHGTHVSGIIAAADNGWGTVGIAPEAELMMVKVITSQGYGSFSWLAEGILHAADAGADVVNMSLGAAFPRHGFTASDGSWVSADEVASLLTFMTHVCQYAASRGCTLVAAAGNEAHDFDHDKDLVDLPSQLPHVLSIAATMPVGWAVSPGDVMDAPASYTNFGQSAIDFAAPGGGFDYPGNEECAVAGQVAPCWVFDLVLSTGSDASYYWAAGTSMACPHAAGVAALIVGRAGGDLHPAQVATRMRQQADDLGKPGQDDHYGGGRVNAGRAGD